jgi:uncharacterized protein YbjT (DUF2867 family)
VGRPAERRRLTELWQDSRGGRARLVVVSGEPDPRDVADVAVEVLTSAGHDGRTYQLTGPEAVTFEDIAAQLSTVLGRPIGFMPVPDDDAVAHMVAAGVPEWFATNVVTQFRLLRQGSQAQTNDVVRVLTGREPRATATFLRDHAAAFAG